MEKKLVRVQVRAVIKVFGWDMTMHHDAAKFCSEIFSRLSAESKPIKFQA
jgi:hypothetical protein